jgi:hypothetical protein
VIFLISAKELLNKRSIGREHALPAIALIQNLFTTNVGFLFFVRLK